VVAWGTCIRSPSTTPRSYGREVIRVIL